MWYELTVLVSYMRFASDDKIYMHTIPLVWFVCQLIFQNCYGPDCTYVKCVLREQASICQFVSQFVLILVNLYSILVSLYLS